MPASVWFPYADTHISVREMKIHAGQQDIVVSRLRLLISKTYGPHETGMKTAAQQCQSSLPALLHGTFS